MRLWRGFWLICIDKRWKSGFGAIERQKKENGELKVLDVVSGNLAPKRLRRSECVVLGVGCE